MWRRCDSAPATTGVSQRTGTSVPQLSRGCLKNQYACDVNDYCKYGLLRVLTDNGRVRSTVAWMLTPDDASADGGKLAYLRSPKKWRWRDPELFDALSQIVVTGQPRSVAAVEALGVFRNTTFVAEHVPRSRQDRAIHFGRVLEAAAGSELIFFDPDNGLEVTSCPPGRQGSDKYLLWSELAAAYAAGHSVLVYQHFPRRSRHEFVTDMATRIAEHTGSRHVIAFRTAGVVFFLAAHGVHTECFAARAMALREPWGGVIAMTLPTCGAEYWP